MFHLGIICHRSIVRETELDEKREKKGDGRSRSTELENIVGNNSNK